MIGLTVSFTHRLIRTRSLQAFALRTTSRASSGFVWHSGAYSEQNSSQPIGARTLLPVPMNKGRSPAAFTGAAISPAASASAAVADPHRAARLRFICCGPPAYSLRSHNSHKQFQAGLSSRAHFKENQNKQRGEL